MSCRECSNGVSGALVHAQGFAIAGNAGYNLALGQGWFVEPSAGIAWSNTSIDPIRVVGTIPVGLTTFVNNGTVDVDNVQSLLGRASLRVGTTVHGAAVSWQPFVVASVFREFAGRVTAVSTDDASANTLNLSIDRIGTYAQVGAGSAVVFGNSGWLGYGRFDYTAGDRIEGFNVSTGLRYQW